jgi:small subunit ribosomal protein S8
MSINDPIADMLTRIRNSVMAGQTLVGMPNSKIKVAIAKILKSEGYIENYQVVDGENPGHKVLRVRLKYIGKRRERKSVITNLERISSPGRRVYAKSTQIPWVLSGLGIAILSTPKGVMTDQRARQLGVGGEILCKVW